MPTADLNRQKTYVDDGLDSIVIVNCLGDIPGGRTLDVTGFEDAEFIKAGHVLVQDKTTKVISPLAVSGDAYGSLPTGSQYIGVLKYSIQVKDPRASVMTIGQVNAAASPYPVTDAIAKALTNIQFLNR